MLNPFKIIFAIDRLLVKIENCFLVITLLVLLLFAFLQVILRNFMDSGIHWADVFNRLLVLWVAVFAATLAAKEDKHLSLEMLTKFLPERAKPAVAVFVNLFVIVVSAFLTHASYLFFKDQIEFESTDLLFQGLPKAYFSIVFPLGFGLICFRYFVKLLEVIYKFAGGDKNFPESSGDSIEISVNVKLK